MNWTAEILPDPMQLEGAEMLLKAKYGILADDMGVGKTWQGMYAATQVSMPTVVVCPASLAYNWRTEFRNLTDARVYTFNKKDTEVPADAEVMIVPYSMLAFAEYVFQWAKVVITDEVQQWKNGDAKRTKYGVTYLTKHRPEYCFMLSGTPIKNRVTEYYVALKILALDPTNQHKITTKFPSYYTFCHHFSNVVTKKYGGQTFTNFTGHKNIPELKTYLKGRYLRRTLDFLKIEEKWLDVAVEYRESSELKAAWELWQDKGISKDIKAKKDTAVAKAPFTADYCLNLKESVDTPIIVVSDHREPIYIISLALSKYRVASITGETPTSKRAEYVQQFQNGQLDFLVMTIGAMEAGHTLTRSHHMVFNDMAWVPASNQQVRGRIKRRGQTKTCIFHRMIGGAMDDHIGKILRSKEKTLKEVLE